MSSIMNFAETSSYNANVINGFDIVDLDNSENMTPESISKESIAKGNFSNLAESSYSSFDFMVSERNEIESLDLESTSLVENADLDLAESEEVVTEASGEEAFALEFFSDGVDIINDFTGEDNNVVVRGVSNDANVEYEEVSGSLSIDGQTLAELDTGLDFEQNGYEIF